MVFLSYFGWDVLDCTDVCLSLLVDLEGFKGRTLFFSLLNRDNERLSPLDECIVRKLQLSD